MAYVEQATTTPHQDRVLAAKSEYYETRDRIEQDDSLSLAGKREAVEKADEKLNAVIAEAKVAQSDSRQKRIIELQKKILDRSVIEGADPALTMAYRDAAERASRISDPNEAAALMASALSNSDTPLAKSLLRIAFQYRWNDVIDKYLERFPYGEKDCQELWDLTGVGSDVANDLVNAMIYGKTGNAASGASSMPKMLPRRWHQPND